MSIQKKLFAELQHLEKESSELLDFLNSAPDGKLIIRTRDQSKKEYYQCISDENGKRSENYIPHADMPLLSSLAWKEYAQRRLLDIQKLQKVTQKYMNAMSARPASLEYLEKHPDIQSLISEHFFPKEEKYLVWARQEYPRKIDKPEGLRFPTVLPGLYVRSKAEADIVSRLVHFGIPFHYEEALSVNGVTLYPDFKCICLSTGKFFWWEHNGQYDKPEYYHNNVERRSSLLYSAGLIPWKNLIITTETLNEPLDIRWVDVIIQYFLL